MAAISYPFSGGSQVLTSDMTSGYAPVRLKDGDYDLIHWLGFICDRGTTLLHGAYAKILASGISQGDVFLSTDWRPVAKDEFVLGWRCRCTFHNRY